LAVLLRSLAVGTRPAHAPRLRGCVAALAGGGCVAVAVALVVLRWVPAGGLAVAFLGHWIRGRNAVQAKA